MGAMDFESSLAKGSHHWLARLAGDWQGTTRTWFEPGKLADESTWQGRIRPVLGGRFALYEYRGSITGKALEGLALLGYDLERRRYEMAWIDAFHTGTAILSGVGLCDDARFAALARYGNPAVGPEWGWRTEIELPSADELVITAWNIPSDGEAARAVETRYERVGE
jgi:Protein of unknown function (DUF1579)